MEYALLVPWSSLARIPYVQRSARLMMSAAIAAAALCLSTTTPSAFAYTGMSDVPLPAVLTHPLQPQEMVAAVMAPTVDINALMKEDYAREGEGLPPRFAIPNQVKISPNDSGTWV